jgi:hypothetical protein
MAEGSVVGMHLPYYEYNFYVTYHHLHTNTLRKSTMIFELITLGGIAIIFAWVKKHPTQAVHERNVKARLEKYPINSAIHLNNVLGVQGKDIVSAGPTSNDPTLRNHLGGQLMYQQPGRNTEAIYSSLLNRMARAEATGNKVMQQVIQGGDLGSIMQLPGDVVTVRLPTDFPAEALGGSRYVNRG